MTVTNCDPARMAELSLGTLEGRERAEALAHLDVCSDCRRELAAYTEVVDRLVAATPEVEPPVGFESRVMARVAADRPSRHHRRSLLAMPVAADRPGRHNRRSLVAMPVAAAIAAAVALGGYAVGHQAESGGDHPVETALVSGHRHVGEVLSYSGNPGIIYMQVDQAPADGPVTCQVREADGRTVVVGSFTLTEGRGSWGAKLPATPSPIVSAQVVDTFHRVVAAARLG